MGQVLSNFIRCVCGESEEEERPSEQQNLLISPAISDSCSDSSINPFLESSTHGVVIDIDSIIQAVGDNRQVSPSFPDLSTREPREEHQAKEEDNEEEKRSNEVERWIQHYSSSHIIQVVEDNRQVSPPLPDLNTREPIREEDQANVEYNEEEKLIISKEKVMKERWIQNYNNSHSIQVVEDNTQVSPAFPDLNTREPIRVEDQANVENNEEEKLIKSKEVVMKERWIEYYSSTHKILLVGEGDFSFSASLAVAFGSATNMVATSLDSTGFLCRNYMKAMSNICKLTSRGCTVIHDVDATEMANHCSLKSMKFDRIIFNFPLAGFFPNESRESGIRQNQTLILLFLENAKKMIPEGGQIHIAHKSRGFFLDWNLEHLASFVGLRLIEELPFNFKDYTGYHTKYGFGGDKNFNCNPSKIYKFGLKPPKIQWRPRICGCG